MNLDDSELEYAARQIKAGRRYVEGYDADTYQAVVIDRLTGERHMGMMAPHLRAVKL